MTSLARKVKQECARKGVEVLLENPPKGSPRRQLNGEVERANETVAGLCWQLAHGVCWNPLPPLLLEWTA